MEFLLVVVLLIFTGSCSVSSHQYYVSDNCSSVNYTPCHPLSAYAYCYPQPCNRNSSYYFDGSDDSIYYFIGTNYTNSYYFFILFHIHNVTLLGLSHSPSIDCGGGIFYIRYSSNISIGNISFNNCSVDVYGSNHVMIADSTHHYPSIDCGGGTFRITDSSDISIGNTSFNNCNIHYQYSNHLIIADSTHYYNQQRKSMTIHGTSNITITNSIFQNFEIILNT